MTAAELQTKEWADLASCADFIDAGVIIYFVCML